VPIAGLAVIQLLQNIDLIAAKHRFPPDLASSYAATAVAAKVLIWVAMGAGFYLVPECSRRRAQGKDTRPVLLKTLLIIGVCAIPCLLIFAVAAHPLLSIVFGARRATASASLLPLGAAFTVLAATYLAVQYMLALKQTAFLVVLGAVAVAEPVLLLQASRHPAEFAIVVLAVQAVGALLAFALALRRPTSAPPATAVNPEAA
jgi:O-antigen/teichoic acid export membrane protein